MTTFDGFLMRDSLQDTGVVPSPGYPYHSPDLICHAQVADPASFFAANYASDPNQGVQIGSTVNYFYVRAKNLSAATLSNHYVSVYRANASLFMKPSIWKNNKLSTHDGQNYVGLPSTAPGQIAVGDKSFLLDGIASSNFCLIGIASPLQNPNVPDDFSTYEAYVVWVRSNQNICGRNLRTLHDFPNRTYEQLDAFSNPEAQSVPTLFQTTFAGPAPAGSTFGITCAPLGINTTWNISSGPTQTSSAMTPANFSGNVTTWATIPGGTWPSGASITTVVYVGVGANSVAAMYRETEWEALDGKAPESPDPERPHLVQLGSCTTVFTTQ